MAKRQAAPSNENRFPGAPADGAPAQPLSIAESYYYGLPSCPRLVARTSDTPWKAPIGPEAYRRRKELYPVFDHPLKDVWGDNLCSDVCTLLTSEKIHWISIDVVRIGYERSTAPVVVWIGVKPSSLSIDDGTRVAFKCLDLFKQRSITDVEVEIRESVVWP